MKDTLNKKSKSYRIKQPVYITVIFITMIVLSLAVTIYDGYYIHKRRIDGFDSLSLWITVIFCILIIVVATVSLIFSSYKIKNGYIVKRTGFFVEKIEIKDITEVKKFKMQNALVVYSGEDYSIISISPAFYDNFVDELIVENKNISYLIV